MVIAALVLVGVVGGLMINRRRRLAMLSGLNSTKPVFSIEPPARRVSQRKHEAL
jgi:hypothetical protein